MTNRTPADASPHRPDAPYERLPMPGRQALLLAALIFGLIMMAIQLWLLTVALELYLAGDGDHVWGLAVGSGIVFGGGMLAVWLLSRRPYWER